MGAGHSHTSLDDSEPTPQAIAARSRANRILAAVLIPVALLTLAGMAALWPSGSKDGVSLANPYSTARGVTFDTGKIQDVVTESCTQGTGQQGTGQEGTGQQATPQQPPSQGSDCTFAFTEPDKGGSPVKVVINPDVASSHGVKPGDQIRYLNLSNVQGAAGAQNSPSYIFVDFVRTLPIVLLAVLYAAVV
ncbi:MAG: YibE/F family protein, partial [Actinomycetes bacterium]